MDLVHEACKRAHIHDDILKLPMGYLSLVGDMGSTLSGGQRQRIFLARALYRQPTILFLDEGTANLDPDNEAKIMETLNGLTATRVVIAHRRPRSSARIASFLSKLEKWWSYPVRTPALPKERTSAIG